VSTPRGEIEHEPEYEYALAREAHMTRIAAVSVVALLAAPPLHAQSAILRDAQPSIVTVGKATVRSAPDRAFVTVATEATAPEPAAVQQQIARTMTAVRAALRAARVPDEAVRTLAYGLQEQVEFPNGKRVRRGYRAVNSLEVRIDDITRVGEVIDAAVKAGANDVSDIRFDLKDRASAEREALTKAVADAKARAEAAAAGAGVSLGAIVRIDEQARSEPLPPPMPMRAMAMVAADAPETPITAGEIEVQASVTLTVAIK
jgi:uncharacterized protein YggE